MNNHEIQYNINIIYYEDGHIHYIDKSLQNKITEQQYKIKYI